jgi:hypothetical protein
VPPQLNTAARIVPVWDLISIDRQRCGDMGVRQLCGDDWIVCRIVRYATGREVWNRIEGLQFSSIRAAKAAAARYAKSQT